MKVISIITLLAIAMLPIYPAQAKKAECIGKVEATSLIKKNIRLEKFGISMDIPANFRTIAKTDGSITIVDNGVYQWMVCESNHPGAGGLGTEISSINVQSSSATYFYSNVYDRVPGKEDMFVIVEINGESYKISLRVKTKTGVIEIFKDDGEPTEGQEQAKYKIQEIIELAQGINIL